MKTKFLIGTVSKLYGISKQTLIYYDKIGLLSPVETVDNHYRYYTYEQMDMLDVILSLKETGMSLKEIQFYLKNRTLGQSIKLLQKQMITIEKRVEFLNKIHTKLDQRLLRLETFRNLKTANTIRILKLPERSILKVPVAQPGDSDISIGIAFKTLNDYLYSDTELSLYSRSTICVTLSKENLYNQSFNKIEAVFVEIDSYKDSIYYDIIPAGTYLSLHHYGTYENSQQTYNRLLQYLNAHHYTIIGDSIEIPQIDAWSVSTESDYITEIQIPIAES